MNDVDQRVAQAYADWDLCHREISETRMAYDRAVAMHMKGQAVDPEQLRTQMQDAQVRCDQLFFAFLRAAEARTRDRYI